MMWHRRFRGLDYRELAQGYGRCDCSHAPCEHDLAFWILDSSKCPLDDLEIWSRELEVVFATPMLVAIMNHHHRVSDGPEKPIAYALTKCVPKMGALFVIGQKPTVYELVSATVEQVQEPRTTLVTFSAVALPDSRNVRNLGPVRKWRAPLEGVTIELLNDHKNGGMYIHHTPRTLEQAFRMVALGATTAGICPQCLGVFQAGGSKTCLQRTWNCPHCKARLVDTTPTANLFLQATQIE